MKRLLLLLPILAIAAGCASTPGLLPDPSYRVSGVRIIEENDVFTLSGDDDNDYTQGLTLTAFRTPEGGGFRQETHSLVNLMYTPQDISFVELPDTYRPYAGLTAYKYGVETQHTTGSSKLELTLGAVGPVSGSEQIQRKVHKWIDSEEPLGWQGNQIKNEPAVNVYGERIWPILEFEGPTDLDVYGGFTAAGGNVWTYGGGLIGARTGINMPEQYRRIVISPSSIADRGKLVAYGFTEMEHRLVAHNAMLSGSLFRDGPGRDDARVSNRDYRTGVALGLQHQPISFMSMDTGAWDIFADVTWTERWPEFKASGDDVRFGSVGLTLRRPF